MEQLPKISRRKVLKASVGGVALPFASTTSLAAKGEPVVVRQKGTWNNPLDVEQMMAVKRQAIDRHVAAGGKPPAQLIDAVPGFPDHAKLVDYIVGVKPNGVPTQHVEVVGGPASVASAHQRADAMLHEVRQKARGEN